MFYVSKSLALRLHCDFNCNFMLCLLVVGFTLEAKLASNKHLNVSSCTLGNLASHLMYITNAVFGKEISVGL